MQRLVRDCSGRTPWLFQTFFSLLLYVFYVVVFLNRAELRLVIRWLQKSDGMQAREKGKRLQLLLLVLVLSVTV